MLVSGSAPQHIVPKAQLSWPEANSPRITHGSPSWSGPTGLQRALSQTPLASLLHATHFSPSGHSLSQTEHSVTTAGTSVGTGKPEPLSASLVPSVVVRGSGSPVTVEGLVPLGLVGVPVAEGSAVADPVVVLVAP